MTAIRDLDRLLAGMQPALQPGRYAFAVLPDGAAIDRHDILASIREAEGLSVVVTEATAVRHALPVAFTAAWITLTVHSDLAAVGLTAAFSRALGAAGISCNVVAGVHHDHLFVPVDQAEAAMQSLIELQTRATSRVRDDDSPGTCFIQDGR